MVGSALVPDQPFHVRSISMPSRLQPLALRVKEGRHKLRTCVTSSTSSATAQMMCSGLRGLGDLYECIDELLRLHGNQQTLSHPSHKKWMEEQLDVSLRLLDLCVAMRDNLPTMKEHVQDLVTALRRKYGAIGSKLHTYILSGKKAQKEIKNCLRSLKQMDSKFSSYSTLDKDFDLSMVVRILMEAREVTISLLQTVFCSLSKPRQKPKDSRWSFVSMALHWMIVAYENELEYTSGIESLEGLETGLECLFGRLIQNRVSLLNILSL